MVNRDLLTAGSVLYKAVTKDKLLKKKHFSAQMCETFQRFFFTVINFYKPKENVWWQQQKNC